MDIILDKSIMIIGVIILILYFMCNNKEQYYNIYGEKIDAPFLEKNDKGCSHICNNMSECTGYNYDSLTGACFLKSNSDEYLDPLYDHYYDHYLYAKYAWLYGPEWINSVYFKKGYLNKNKLNEIPTKLGSVGNLIGGGHGGRIEGNSPSDNSVKMRK